MNINLINKQQQVDCYLTTKGWIIGEAREIQENKILQSRIIENIPSDYLMKITDTIDIPKVGINSTTTIVNIKTKKPGEYTEEDGNNIRYYRDKYPYPLPLKGILS